MDNLTHSLTGVLMSRCGLNRGVAGTTLMVVIAANIPDIDAISWAGGTLTYLDYHRGLTHSFAFVPVMAAAAWAIVRFFGRKPIGWWEYAAAIVGVISHLLLDFTNIYGIRLLLPFSDRWLRLDMTDLIDPWILAIFFAALAIPALVKLVSDEIGGRKSRGPVKAWAWIAIVLLLGYEGLRYSSHERALAILDSHLYLGDPPVRVTAVPDRLNPFLWRGIVEGEEFVDSVSVDVNEPFDPNWGHVDYPAESSRYLEIAKQTRAFQIFGNFNQVPFWRLRPEPDGMRVELLDLRFGTPTQPGFMAVAEIEANGHINSSTFQFGAIPRP